MKVTNPRGYDLKPDDKVPSPTVSKKDGIGINGIGRNAHEPFTISCKGRMSMGFMKTARKPYDDVVMCVLLRAYMLAPSVVQVS